MPPIRWKVVQTALEIKERQINILLLQINQLLLLLLQINKLLLHLLICLKIKGQQ